MWIRSLLLVSACLACGGASGADGPQMLADFEAPALGNLWEVTVGKAQLSRSGALEGRQSLEIVFDAQAESQGAYMVSFRLPRDWSAYDALVVDVLNPNDEPVPASLLIADRAWEESGRNYWNRHNASRTFPPGRTEWVIAVAGLYRGEAGSRNNDIKRDINPASITRVDFGFGAKGQRGKIVLDAIRLVKATPPEDVWAGDFGPPGQSVMLGWKPVSNETGYAKELGYGWGPQGGKPWNGAARDTGFAGPLLGDWCEAGGYNFRVDVPAGPYRVMVAFESAGYWGGEQAQQRERRVLANGQVVWRDERADGSAHALYRFEQVEPVGIDLWDTYMAPELAKSAVFDVTAGSDGITLRFEADRVWGCKVAAIAIHPAKSAAGGEWLAGQWQKIANEFRSQAVRLDGPAAAFDAPPAWSDRGLVAWGVRIEDDVVPTSTPGTLVAPQELTIARRAARAEMETLCIAVRPLKDLGKCRLELEPFTGAGTLEGEVRVVWYNTSRDFGNIAYHVRPHTLRAQREVALPAGVTRELVVSVVVPRSAKPGSYRGALAIKAGDGTELLRVPLELDVRAVTLERQSEFLMGFFGLMPPELIPADERATRLAETLRLLRAYGMNALSGGPDWRLTGWKAGQPTIDFGELDDFFALVKRYGFSGPINGYGGLRFERLHDGYQRGETAARVERESGLAYEEALGRAWRAFDAHAREAGWPTIYYAMCDETRVRDAAERELALMRPMARASAALPQTFRTSGSYSVSFQKRPTDQDDMLYWHQEFFKALDISALNSHDASVLEEARKLGKEVHIYNQGQSRYSFGLYQWSEFRQGVRARWQWHLNVLHGYQFFDLDGREPDTAMICYGRKAIYPTIHFERCREGAEDFYLYQTLAGAVEKSRGDEPTSAGLRGAAALLERFTAEIKLDQREPPGGYDADALKAEVLAALEGQ